MGDGLGGEGHGDDTIGGFIEKMVRFSLSEYHFCLCFPSFCHNDPAGAEDEKGLGRSLPVSGSFLPKKIPVFPVFFEETVQFLFNLFGYSPGSVPTSEENFDWFLLHVCPHF